MGFAVRRFLGSIVPHLRGSLALLLGFHSRCKLWLSALGALRRFSGSRRFNRRDLLESRRQQFYRAQYATSCPYSPECVEAEFYEDPGQEKELDAFFEQFATTPPSG